MNADPARWVLGAPDEGAPAERLFCFPHAGAGASVFTPWRAHLPDSVIPFPVQLPGRENRYAEPLPDNLEVLTGDLAEALLPLLRPPYVLFGHSFGGLVAFALARNLRSRGHPLPRKLLLSGARPPDAAPGIPSHTMSDPELLRFLRETDGLPERLLAHPELIRTLLRGLRADLRLAAEYHPASTEPLPCDLHAFAGLDDPVVSAREMAGWRDHTTGTFTIQAVPGDHRAAYDTTGRLFDSIVQSGLAPAGDRDPEARVLTTTPGDDPTGRPS